MSVDSEFLDRWGVDLTDAKAKDVILIMADGYRKRKIEKRLYSENDFIPENIIAMYLLFVLKKNYSLIIENYKHAYVTNEALVEPGVTPEERVGLGLIYDYIGHYDYEKESVNAFITSLRLHCILYSACPFPEYGGKLRQDTAVLNDTDIEVMDAHSARMAFQNFISKKIEFDETQNVFDYIDDCIKTAVDLIRIQPFSDGNKRTFRALLNLMLGKIGIPPVFITLEEREEYKKQLLKALSNYDYKGITRFYYYKICDSIVDFGIKNIEFAEKNESDIWRDAPKRFVIKPQENNHQ